MSLILRIQITYKHRYFLPTYCIFPCYFFLSRLIKSNIIIGIYHIIYYKLNSLQFYELCIYAELINRFYKSIWFTNLRI